MAKARTVWSGPSVGSGGSVLFQDIGNASLKTWETPTGL